MRNWVKFAGISLLMMTCAACDDSDSDTAAIESHAHNQTISLLNGKLSFLLPAEMTNQGGNMHVYADASGKKTVLVIMGSAIKEDLAVLAQRMVALQRSRDPQLQIVGSKTITINGHPLWQLDSIISIKGQRSWSSIVLGKIDDNLLTMQITQPIGDQKQAQIDAENIISTITIQ